MGFQIGEKLQLILTGIIPHVALLVRIILSPLLSSLLEYHQVQHIGFSCNGNIVQLLIPLLAILHHVGTESIAQ